MNFHIGQRVICVDAYRDPLLSQHADWPIEGQEYTVIALTRSKGRDRSRVGLQLAEIANSGWNEDVGCLVSYGVSARRFRAATSVAVFEALLTVTSPVVGSGAK